MGKVFDFVGKAVVAWYAFNIARNVLDFMGEVGTRVVERVHEEYVKPEEADEEEGVETVFDEAFNPNVAFLEGYSAGLKRGKRWLDDTKYDQRKADLEKGFMAGYDWTRQQKFVDAKYPYPEDVRATNHALREFLDGNLGDRVTVPKWVANSFKEAGNAPSEEV